MGSVRRFARLPLWEKRCFLEALFLLPLTVVAIRAWGLQRWQARLLRFGASRPGARAPQPDIARARRVARMVAAAARRVPMHTTCLHNSVVLWWLLRRQGLGGELRLGSRMREGRLEAHAWVECAGEVLNDSEDVHVRFLRFDRAIVPEEANSR